VAQSLRKEPNKISCVALDPKWHLNRGQNGGANINALIERALGRKTASLLQRRPADDREAIAQVWGATRDVYCKLGHEDWANAFFQDFVAPLQIPWR
jgi:hypothetical protein